MFTLPAPIADIAYQNKHVIYDLLFKAAAETTITIAADPKHLGARIGITAVLHTWGSAMTHHPHVHMIVPGGGLSDDGSRWVSCRPSFFLSVRVLSRLFRRLFLEMLVSAHAADQFAETDTAWAPWFVARSDDKRRARLNIISHLLSRVPYESPPREKVKLPKRKTPARVVSPSVKIVPEKF